VYIYVPGESALEEGGPKIFRWIQSLTDSAWKIYDC